MQMFQTQNAEVFNSSEGLMHFSLKSIVLLTERKLLNVKYYLHMENIHSHDLNF